MTKTTDASRELSEAAKEWVSQNKSGLLIYGPYQFAGHAFKAGADWQAALSTKQPMPLSEDLIKRQYDAIGQVNIPTREKMGLDYLAATSIKSTSENAE